ncbi:MAG: hypothetical protein JW940_07335 [Polyangiaceae bacterium]|nr:hypothetical protein [Polyangiaceae bacterium]
MSKLQYVLGALLLAGGAVVCVVAFSGSHSAKARAIRDTTSGSDAASAETPDQQEVSQLRAELRRKDAMIRAMAVSRAAEAAAPAPAQPDEPSNEVDDPTAQACDTLDERMLTAPPDGRTTAEMERAVESMLEPRALGSTKVRSHHCGGALCKIVLLGESSASLNDSLIALSQRTPKLFAGSMAYPTATNERALYLATEREALSTEPALPDQEGAVAWK